MTRWGFIEAETLRRFGRLPAGTSGRGELMLMTEADGSGGVNAGLWVSLRFGDDPRAVTADLYFHWDRAADKPGVIEWHTKEGVVEVATPTLLEAAARLATLFVESNYTRRGYQHFRVTGAVWKPERSRKRKRG